MDFGKRVLVAVVESFWIRCLKRGIERCVA
jgi:hypothetical protein